MDPITAVGFVATLIQLIGVSAKVIGYVNSVKDAPTERAQLSSDTVSLLGLFNDLKCRLEEAKSDSDPWFVGIRSLGQSNGPLDQLRRQMEGLETKLMPPSTGRIKTARKALVWALLSKKEVQDVLAQIERVKTLIMLALEKDHFKLALAMKQDLADVKGDLQGVIKQDLADIKKDLQGAAADRTDEEFQKVTSWLSSIDFAAKQMDFHSRQQPGTGEWLLSDPKFQHWLEGHERILWCPGQPGAGKTILASMVIDWLENKYQGPQAPVLYLYYSYKEEHVQTPRNMIGSLLKQVVQHRAALSDDVRRLHDKHHAKNTHPGLDELSQLLVQEVKTYSSLFVIIDALDECPERDNTRGSLLAEIQKLPQHTRVLITSRYSPKIEESFENVPQIDIRATDGDVKRYVEARIKREGSLSKHVRTTPDLLLEITRTVVENSQGMFLLAQLHMDSLAKKLTRRAIRTAMGSLPKELDETYDQAMQRIENQDEGRPDLAHKVLHWISRSLRPLTIPELLHALAVEEGDEDLDEDGLYETELIVSVCAGLVTVDEESNQIRLVHYTTQNYLERVGISRLSEAPFTIVKTCLTYLAFSPFADTFCASEEELPIRLGKYPFLRYAATYWGDHMRDGMDDAVRDLALEWLKNRVSIWSATQAWQDLKKIFGSYGARDDLVTNPSPLHMVAAFGLVDMARHLLEGGVDVDAKMDRGQTPLHVAARAGDVDIVRLLLQSGATVDSEDSIGYTPLHFATENGNESIARTLVEAGADVDPRRYGSTPLERAIRNGHLGLAKFLISKGASVNQEGMFGPLLLQVAYLANEDFVRLVLESGADVSVRTQVGETALHQAVKGGNVQVLKLLIARGIDASVHDKYDRSPLQSAARRGQKQIVQVLLENNANVLARGGAAIGEAVMGGHTDVLKMLLAHIGQEDKTERFLATMGLVKAVDGGDEEEVGSLLGKGAFPDFAPEGGLPLLHTAITRNDGGIAKLLLANSADVNGKDDDGNTALHWAASRGYHAGVKLLLDYNADIEARDGDGETPLHFAAAYARTLVVKELLDNGAQLDAKDSSGYTAISRVFDPIRRNTSHVQPGSLIVEQDPKEFLAVLDLLIERGADMHTPQPEGDNLLRLAVSYSSYNVDSDCHREKAVTVALARRLLENEFDLAARGMYGQTALLTATDQGIPEVVQDLLEHGADVNERSGHSGRTALHEVWNEEVARLLIEAGADVNAVDDKGFTVLHQAASLSRIPIIDLLLAHGADINARNVNDQQTALHAAVQSRNMATVRHLLERGARLDVEDSKGVKALDLAKRWGDEPMISLLSS